MITLTEATAPGRAYQRRVDAILHSLDALTTTQVRQMLRIIAEARQQVVADLATVHQENGTWPAYRLRALLAELDRVATEIGTRYGQQLRTATGEAWNRGAAFVPETLGAAGIEVGHLPALSRTQIEVAMQLQGDLIKRVTQEFRTHAAAEVTRAVMGGQSPYQATQAVARLLTTQRQRRGQAGVAARAETIVVTETMTAFSLANEARQEQVAREVPSLRKTWMAALDGRTRPDHASAAARYSPGGTPGPIRVDQMFVVGGERCTGPHSPMLSAAQRVRCRCVSTMWSPEWVS